MKFLATLFFASIAISPAIAQNKKALLNQLNQRNHYMAIQALMYQNKQNAALLKTTGVHQRLIADASTDLTVPALVDSSNYHYNNSPYRGSTFDYNLMTYMQTYSPVQFPTFPAPSFVGLTSASVPSVLCDTLNEYADNGAGLELAVRQYNTFVNNTQIADMKTYNYPSGSSLPDTGNRFIHSYDGQGRLSNIMELNWSGVNNNWDTIQSRHIYYNSQNLPQTDSIYIYDSGNWIAAAANAYTYSGSNTSQIDIYSYDGSNWARTQQFQATYYSNNQLQTVNFNIDTGLGAPPVPLFRDTFGYSSTTFCTSWASFINATGAGLDSFFVQTKHLNSQNLPDSAFFRIAFSGSATSWIETFTYNSGNNPDVETDYDAVGSPAGYQIKYYYENYNDLAVITPAKNNNITIYPNPSSGQLNIQWKEANGAKAAISIVNAAGQLVYSDAFNWKQSTESISIANLQAGIYWVNIADNTGNVIYRQSVVKQ
jgi:hypothetical protein